MHREFLSKYSTYIIFLTISIFYAIGNFIWWYQNTPFYPSTNECMYFNNVFEKSLLYFNAPLITWISKIIFFVFGTTNFDLQRICINYVFFLIGLYFIYKIGSEICSVKTGNIAMLVFSIIPPIYEMSRRYNLEYNVCIAIIINFYFLIKTNNLRSQKWTFLYGISIGFGLLIKDTFFYYSSVLFLSLLAINLLTKKYYIKNIIIVVLTSLLIAGIHYLNPNIIHKLLYDNASNTTSILSLQTIQVMIVGLWNELLSPPIFIFFIVSLIWFVIRYKKQYKIILLLWIFIPYIAIFLMKHYKSTVYMYGFIPAIVIIISLWYSSIKQRKIKIFILTFLILSGILQYIDFSYIVKYKIFNDTYYKKDNILYKIHEKNDINIFIGPIDYIKVLTQDLFIWTPEDPLNKINKLKIFMNLYAQDVKYTMHDYLIFNTTISINEVLKYKYILSFGKVSLKHMLNEKENFYNDLHQNFSSNIKERLIELYKLIYSNYIVILSFPNTPFCRLQILVRKDVFSSGYLDFVNFGAKGDSKLRSI